MIVKKNGSPFIAFKYVARSDSPEKRRVADLHLLSRSRAIMTETALLQWFLPHAHTHMEISGLFCLSASFRAAISRKAKYTCHRMIFRCYSTRPLVMKPITQHRSWIAVNPCQPLRLRCDTGWVGCRWLRMWGFSGSSRQVDFLSLRRPCSKHQQTEVRNVEPGEFVQTSCPKGSMSKRGPKEVV